MSRVKRWAVLARVAVATAGAVLVSLLRRLPGVPEHASGGRILGPAEPNPDRVGPFVVSLGRTYTIRAPGADGTAFRLPVVGPQPNSTAHVPVIGMGRDGAPVYLNRPPRKG